MVKVYIRLLYIHTPMLGTKPRSGSPPLMGWASAVREQSSNGRKGQGFVHSLDRKRTPLLSMRIKMIGQPRSMPEAEPRPPFRRFSAFACRTTAVHMGNAHKATTGTAGPSGCVESLVPWHTSGRQPKVRAWKHTRVHVQSPCGCPYPLGLQDSCVRA